MSPRSLLQRICRHAALAGVLAVLAPGLCASEDLPAYRDTAQPLEARVRDLVSRLTLEEKASLLVSTSPGVERLGIPRYDWWNEALHGVARAGEATVFPQAIGLAAMWDEPFMREVAHAIGIEGRAKHHEAKRTGTAGRRYTGLTFWSPNINIFRDPRWGRGQETYGEDPFLTARTGVAFVRGLQGDARDQLLAAACAKHFAVHSGPEPKRHDFDAVPGEPDLHDTYLPAFEALVREGQVEAVMMAYNAIDGEPCSINERLYDLLYHRWGFDGHVVSDCWSINDLFTSYKRAADMKEAEALSVNAGLCLRCGDEPTELALAVAAGLITEEVLDHQLHRLLRTMFRLGFFDPEGSVPHASIPYSRNNSPEHAQLALRAARESVVLLRNNGILPIDASKLRTVAVIGPNADSVSALLGNYNGTPTAPVTILAGLRAALEPAVRVISTPGCDYVAAPDGLSPVPRSAMRHGSAGGLLGRVYRNEDFSGDPAFTDHMGPIALDWTGQAWGNGTFSIRWEGDLTARFSGDYTFEIAGHGPFRMYLGGELAADAWDSSGDASRTLRRTLSAGEPLAVRIEYKHTDGPARLAFRWSGPPADAGFAAALAAAREADVVVFAGGISPELEGEEMPVDYEGFAGGDRTRIELPAIQERLLRELHASRTPVVLVSLSGSAIAFPWADETLPAILQAWYPGQAGGTAVADILLGRVSPSGRLPVTFYHSTADLPDFEDYRMEGRSYRYFRGRALYPFGHGLSYTTFTHGPLTVTRTAAADLEAPGAVMLRARIHITNTGRRAGAEVVQLYAHEPAGSGARAIRSLCGFARAELAPGESTTVEIDVPAAALRRWSPADPRRIPRGEWEFAAGASSADLRARVRVRVD